MILGVSRAKIYRKIIVEYERQRLLKQVLQY